MTHVRGALVALLVLLAGCGGSSSPAVEGAGGPSTDGDGTHAVGEGDPGELDALEGGDEPGEHTAAGGDPAANEAPHPDSISSTPSEATYTACDPAPPAGCADCTGVRVELRRRRGWQASRYDFEILTEGNHIRCRATLPCDSTAPIACDASPGAPQVVVETAGCGGPAAGQSLVALRFPAGACPAELRIEAFRDGIRAAAQDIRPRYAARDACGGTCTTASATLDLAR